MNLLEALQTKNVLTENGMATNSSSLNHCVDLFFQIGTMRDNDDNTIINAFIKAYEEDSLIAMKMLFWCRDIRGGAGERNVFRVIIKYLANNRTISLRNNLHLMPEYGRWDDVFELFGTKLEKDALELISNAINSGDVLAAKWCPRPNTKNKLKRSNSHKLRKYMGLTPKLFRQLLSNNSNTVEQLMCAKKFGEIEYPKVPSKAMSDYMRAFSKRDGGRFIEFLESVKSGKTKINSGALYPYDVIKNLMYGVSDGADAQWDSLPNYLEGNKERLLPVVDVSGSMTCSAGGNELISCLTVAISLGLYISERNEGPFKDSFITFSNNPKINILKGSLKERFNQLKRSDWGMSTNIEGVFKEILKSAVKHSVSPEDMPTMVIILSDMEFNYANSGDYNHTVQEMVEKMYREHGYMVPKLVYWNLNAKGSNFPVKYDKEGTCLVSGFNPSILTSILRGDDLTPLSIMVNTLSSERYDKIVD